MHVPLGTPSYIRFGVMLLIAVAVAMGCATTPHEPEALQETSQQAYSVRTAHDELYVAVSPVRRSVQIVHSSVAVVGATVDAVVNDRFQRRIRETLPEYDFGAEFENAVSASLGAHMPPNSHRVPPMGSTAGYQSRRQAQEARFQALARDGHELVLDNRLTYGLYGPEATLVTKLESTMYALPSGRRLFDQTIYTRSEPVYANMELRDPTFTYPPNLDVHNIRFAAEDDALDAWLMDSGAPLRDAFDEAVTHSTEALLTALELEVTPDGAYWMGVSHLLRRRYDTARAYFEGALAGDPGHLGAANGLAVTLARKGEHEEAIAMTESLVEEHPNFMPGWFNLAWWRARETGAYNEALEAYQRALELDGPRNRRIERTLDRTVDVGQWR